MVLRRATVRSRAKLTYEQVQEHLDGGVADENLNLLREVGLLLQEQERLRGECRCQVQSRRSTPMARPTSW